MFCLFINDVFFSFWQNYIGDIFIANTISKLGLNASEVDLVYYSGVNQPPEHFDFNGSKSLLIQNQIITPTQIATLDENGDPVLDENLQPTYHNEDVVTYETASTVAIDSYYAKGVQIKAC